MRNRLGHQTGALWIAASLWAGCGGSSNAPTGMTQAPNGADPSAANSGTSPSAAGTPGAAGSSSPGTVQTPTPGSNSPAQAPVTGATDFVSADLGQQGSGGTATAGAADNAASVPAPSAPAAASGAAGTASTREVDRGDVYAVLPDHRILNLNAYRGVQVIDISAVDQPKIEGRLAVAGTPVEMYVVGDRAFVLLNDWQGYYRVDDGAQVDTESGGLVLSVDISDRTKPTLIAQANVPGQIVTSRLTQGTGQIALYVAATNYNANAEAVVKSFDVSDGKLTPKTELNLGGYVNDIQATTDVLMVSAQDPTSSDGRSVISVIDISKPDGTMVRGGSVVAAGMVQNKFNMDAYNGVLRIVSGASWSATQQNQVETFDLHDINALKPLDRCNFGGHNLNNGESEQLYATLFVGNDAFFVTYYRKDPFHAFSIDDQGQCSEHSEFVVSGWNDFLRATLNNTRLIGIGHNDQNNTQTLSVSLYDASNLSNPNPLEARADIDLTYSYSQASWDDRAFTVLDDAASVQASDGTTETGVVLLPYDGWDANGHNVDQVQIFTFSDHTLTKRGVMDHGSSVQRSFDATTATANLSDDALSLFDTTNPDAPKELGRVDVAPDYSQVFVYGDYVARVKDAGADLNYSSNDQAPPDSVQIVARSGDVDADAPVATFEVPGGSNLIQVGNLLVSVLTSAAPNPNNQTQTYTSKIQVFDLSDPTKPAPRGTLQTDRLQPNGGGLYYPVDAVPVASGPIGVGGGCFDCGRPYNPQVQNYVVGSAIAFVNTQSQQKSLGNVHQCSTYAPGVACASDKSGNVVCPGGPGSSSSYYSGGINCTTPAGGTQSCSGGFQLCDANGSCQDTTTPPNAMTSCNDYEQFRYWTSYAFDPLDLSNPDQPSLAPRLSLPLDEEGTSLLAAGSTLYFNYQQPITMPGDARDYVKHFVRLLDFSTPSAPATGDSVNIPGDVIAADSSTLYTNDFVWNQTEARTLVSRLTLSGSLAHLQASRLFADREVSAVVLDQANHILVSSDPTYSGGVALVGAPPPSAAIPASSGTSVAPIASTAPAPTPTPTPVHTLNILDSQSLADVGEADVAQWATLKGAEQGRALFQVSGGLLVFDVRDATKPTAQAYFPSQAWPDDIYFDGQDILFAAGRYGVYRFDASTMNLMMMP